MGDTTKGDPILRVVLIVFVGLLVFGFLFGGNFGGTGNMAGGGGHHGAASSGYGGGMFFGGLIPGLIGFLMHLLVLVLVFALIAGLVMGVRKFINQPGGLVQSSKAMEYVNQDPVLRTMAIVLAVVFGLYFISALFNGIQFGGYGASPQFMLFALIGFLVKLLMLALVITLTVALVQYLKAQFEEQNGSQQSSSSNSNPLQTGAPAQLTSSSNFNPNGNKPGDKLEGK